ncbi:class II fumarate hydratase [Aliikangiella coralliicola]|uniref:Fumarate hydratase class II n=1 Tax=Aliikangiella coralliicola TaxID=2592383 RepID=A0A545UCE2_9GAMM|nr:class II fumarate hydratase [Aliikangiella coralliicola]TQV87134.1 class II fumarate hydratase [Aliikangiella coralliicola]
MNKTRIEKDSMGELEVPFNALYGAQTQRAVNNFPISGQPMPEPFIHALLAIKASAARANSHLNSIDNSMAEAIVDVCSELLARDDSSPANSLMQHFPVDVFQTGSGTSTNMNANEVIAHLASIKLGSSVNANDHVNFGQSSNDVIPTALHVSAATQLHNKLLPALIHLATTIENKADTLSQYCKTGRTHLMDAMPVRMDQSLRGWAEQIHSNIRNLQSIQPAIQTLAQGGTAVGTGINAHPKFARSFTQFLSELIGIKFSPASNHFALISSQDTAVALSGQLKTTAVSIMKISNDLRWMNSGPLAGLGEISLEALQPGSSIMPGKVNPVIPEATAMVAAQVIGNDAAITIGGQSGNFELNVMLPMVAFNLLNSIELLSNSVRLLADKAIATFEVNQDKLTEALDRNPILVTALNPIIGYLKASQIAKQAYQEKRPVIDVAAENTDLSREELKQLLDPDKLTRGGL